MCINPLAEKVYTRCWSCGNNNNNKNHKKKTKKGKNKIYMSK